jgi:hypothetical protein
MAEPMSESDLIETALKYLSVGLDQREVLAFAVSDGKLLGFQQGSEVAKQSLDEFIRQHQPAVV